MAILSSHMINFPVIILALFSKPNHGQSGTNLRELLATINIKSPPFWKAVSQQPQYRHYFIILHHLQIIM